MEIKSFEFSPFSENTYVLFDETKEAIILDPGCFDEQEEAKLSSFIEEMGLSVVRLINTHCHIDHVFGNHFVSKRYDLKLEAHPAAEPVLQMAPQVASMYAVPFTPSPPISNFIEEGDQVVFGKTTLDVLWVPGHSPGSICFLHRELKIAIVGDVLFNGSIGRTDLPGGDHNSLIRGIKEKLLPLGDDWVVYNGHGPSTTIGKERTTNPFLI